MCNDKTNNEKVKYGWEDFIVWCDANGVSLEYDEDWEPWWDCWQSAYNSMDNMINQTLDGMED